jgi:hypothetical protein
MEKPRIGEDWRLFEARELKLKKKEVAKDIIRVRVRVRKYVVEEERKVSVAAEVQAGMDLWMVGNLKRASDSEEKVTVNVSDTGWRRQKKRTL